MSQHQSKVSPLPGPQVLAAFAAFVNSIVDERLKAVGALAAQPDPRAIRTGKGLSVGDLAAKSGLSSAVISKIETGRARRPAPDTLDRLARGLGVSAQDERTRLQAAVNEKDLPAIWFNDHNQNMRAAIMVRDCGDAILTMFGADQKPRLVIGITNTENQYRISIFDEKGETVLALPQKKEGESCQMT